MITWYDFYKNIPEVGVPIVAYYWDHIIEVIIPKEEDIRGWEVTKTIKYWAKPEDFNFPKSEG